MTPKVNMIIYECQDLDYQASYEKLLQSNIFTLDWTGKGLLWARYDKFHWASLISPNGKVQAFWEDPKEKEILLDIFRSLLVSKSGEKVELRPLKQTLTVNYPAPRQIQLWWCREKDAYIHLDEFESEFEKARAYQIIRRTEALVRPLTRGERKYFNQKDGKRKLDKAKALQTKIVTDASW